MTWHLWLDILLVLLLLLFIPIGYMRGPIRELFVVLGVVFGALLAIYWARPWGADLDSYTDIGDDAGSFVVAISFLVGSTLIGGYGLGLTIAPASFKVQGRVLGAVISVFSGALLISFALQYVRLFLLSDDNEASLGDSYVVAFLLDEIGWLMLFGAIAVVPVIGYVLFTGQRAYEYEIYGDYEYDDYSEDDLTEQYDEDEFPEYEPELEEPVAAVEYRTSPPRVPQQPPAEETSSYKTDPVPEPANFMELTGPVTVEESAPAAGTVAAAGLASRLSVMGDTDPDMEIISDADEAVDTRAMSGAASSIQQDDLPEGYKRCVNCHAVLPPGSHLCPVCGVMN